MLLIVVIMNVSGRVGVYEIRRWVKKFGKSCSRLLCFKGCGVNFVFLFEWSWRGHEVISWTFFFRVVYCWFDCGDHVG